MSTVAKVFVVLNFLLAALFLGSASALLGHSDNWKARHERDTATLTAQLTTEKNKSAALESEKAKLETDKNNAEKAAGESKREAQVVQTNNATLKEKFDALATAHQSLQRQAQIAQSTIDNLQKLVDVLNNGRKADIDSLNKANDEKNAAVKMQNALEANLADLQRQYKDVLAKLSESSTSLERANFELENWRKKHPGDGPGTEQPYQTAKVLTADNANNIVVISLGAEDGVKVGYRYTISRGNQYIGTLTVTSTQAKMAAGKMTMGGGQPMPGDDAMTSLTK